MSILQTAVVCDCSTLANFKSWAQTISGAFSSFGWVQSSDSGQVNWSTIASVPASGAYVFEIWKPGDGLANFYYKVEYGYTNNPNLRHSIGLATNGAGTLTGVWLGPYGGAGTVPAAPSASNLYQCYLSGSPSRIGAALWQGAGTSSEFFAVERSLDSSGAYTGSYVTLWLAGNVGFNNDWLQRSFHITKNLVAPGPAGLANLGTYTVPVRCTSSLAGAFDNQIPFDTPSPCVGPFDYPATVFGVTSPSDVTEGVTFPITLYGASHPYLPLKTGVAWSGSGNIAGGNLCLRWD